MIGGSRSGRHMVAAYGGIGGGLVGTLGRRFVGLRPLVRRPGEPEAGPLVSCRHGAKSTPRRVMPLVLRAWPHRMDALDFGAVRKRYHQSVPVVPPTSRASLGRGASGHRLVPLSLDGTSPSSHRVGSAAPLARVRSGPGEAERAWAIGALHSAWLHRTGVAGAAPTVREYHGRPMASTFVPLQAVRQRTGAPHDRLGRPVHDLRVSVTDRCNFRCVYCMPKKVFGRDYQFLPRTDLLSFEEIERLARAFVANGVRKIRITGGEPLVRRNVERLVELLAAIDHLDLTLTTNGALLPGKAQALKDAGLRRITVSLDSLDDATFRAMNDVDFPVARVLEGIDAAAAAGLPVKVNVVLKRGLNDGDVLDLARHFRGTGHTLRFIEYMDVGHTNGWRMDDVVPAAEIVRMIGAELPLEPVEPAYRGEVARRWRYVDDGGELGVIASVTQPFCGDCTRARVSADGKLYTCLFAVRGHDLRALVRSEADDGRIADEIASLWRVREDRYSELRSAATRDPQRVEMSYIGG